MTCEHFLLSNRATRGAQLRGFARGDLYERVKSPLDLSNSAVDEELTSRHETAVVGGEECSDLGYFVVATNACKRRDAGREIEKAADLVFSNSHLVVAGGFDNAGAHDIHA